MNEPTPQNADSEPPALPLLSGPKRQHYLPRFYLEGFAGNDGCIAVFDRDKRELRRQQPVNTGVAGHMYTVIDEEGRKRYELEAVLAQVEGAASQHLPRMITGETLDDEQRAAVAHFFALLAVRTPEFIKSIQSFNGELIKWTAQMMFSTEEQAAHAIQRNPEHQGKSDDEIIRIAKDMVEFAQTGEFVVETDYQWAMTTALPMGDNIAPIFFERNWMIVTAPKGSAFVTADAPLILSSLGSRRPSIYGTGYGSDDALVIVPLCSTHALAMYGWGRKMGYKKVDGRTVRRVNLDIARRAQRFLLARDDALAQSISSAARMQETEWTPKFSMDLAPSKIPVK